MNRSILLSLVAALALAVGANGATAAVEGGAQAAAKKKAGKKKAAKCPAKPKKGKKKAGKSLADSAAKKKGKKKAAKCKPKPKKKAKAKPKDKAPPKGPSTPKPQPPSVVFGDGGYKDSGTGLNVIVGGGGQTAEVTFVVPADDGCPGIGALIGSTKPFARSATQAKASDTVSIPGLGVQVTWDLTVQLPSLTYVLQLDSQYSMPADCASQTTRQGTLVKQ